jgi:uncharacterized protein involved in exopolysaccharide biosynthesis
LPFDPVRLLAGVLSRWPWIAIGMIVCGTLGTLLGIRTTHPSFTLSVSLIKRRVPHTVQISEIGQAYRPVDLNDATLLATLLATEPLDLTLKLASNGLEPNRIRGLVEAKQLEGTDIFYITYHSPVSPEDAVTFTSLWATEINAYTQRLQQTEAREVLLILQKEVAELEGKMNANNLEILNFSKAKDYLGGESQVAAALAKLSQIELQLETSRTKAAATEAQLKNFTEQIQRQSPIELQLKTAKEELANLRATYTDANPLVQTKLQSIEYLDEQIGKLAEKGQADLDAYTGTPLGNSLYLSILGLRNEQLEATSQIQALEKLYQTTLARLAEFPGIVSSYEALKDKGKAITEGLTLMSNRLKEAEIFASGAPGYWQVFQTPDPRLIQPSSLVKKPALLGVACGVLGAGFAVLLTLLFTHRSARRSVIECCSATGAPLIAHIPSTFETDTRAAIERLWITHLAPLLHTPIQILWWTPALTPADERRLWSMLASAAWNDTGKALRIHDLTPDSLWSDAPRPDSLEWWGDPSSSAPPTAQPFTASLLRASCLPHGEARELLAQVNFWSTVVAGQKGSLRRAAEFRALSDAYLPPCNGTIAWTERPSGPIRQAADVLSCFLAKRFS